MNLRQLIDAEQRDKGLGDTIARVTTAVGFKPCTPCKKRAEALNQKFPYRQGSTPARDDGWVSKRQMNLQATIELYAGGPGSGCNGPNCGRPKSSWSDEKPEPGFLYHGTTEEHAQDMVGDKLRTHRPNEFTDQSSWPDGKTEKRSYFSKNPAVTESFVPEGRPALLRVPTSAAKFQTESTGDVYARTPIDSKHLEILGDEGAWHKLNEFYK